MPDDTSEYSSTKAPDTREAAEERDDFADMRLIPGGAEPRTHTQQGMAGLDRDTVPNEATDPRQTRYRETGKKDVTGG